MKKMLLPTAAPSKLGWNPIGPMYRWFMMIYDDLPIKNCDFPMAMLKNQEATDFGAAGGASQHLSPWLPDAWRLD